MKKSIKIGNEMVEMSASALTPFSYKRLFGRDIIKDIQQIQKDAQEGNLDPEIVVMLVYIMAKEANKDLPPLEEWLSGFELFEVYECFNDAITLWGLNEQQNSTPVKK